MKITVTVNKFKKVEVTPVIVTDTIEPPVGRESLLLGRKGFLDESNDTLYIDGIGLEFLFLTDIDGKPYASFFASDFKYREAF